MANSPRGTKANAQVAVPPMPAGLSPHARPTAGILPNPYFPQAYPNLPPHSLWYGQVPYNLPFPLPHPQQYMAPPTTSVVPTQHIEYPVIAEWLTYCDDHPQHSGEDFASLAPKFDKEGYRHVNQLTGECITVEKLAQWLGIGKGTADLIIMYAEEDMVAICAGMFQMSFSSHGQNIMHS
jgi:hypothetical protein